MKIRILLVVFTSVSVFGNSQEHSSDSDKCIYFKMLGDKAFSNNDFYDQTNDFMRASFILKSTNPDYKKAADLFVRAINKENVNLNCWGIKVLIPQ